MIQNSCLFFLEFCLFSTIIFRADKKSFTKNGIPSLFAFPSCEYKFRAIEHLLFHIQGSNFPAKIPAAVFFLVRRRKKKKIVPQIGIGIHT